MCPLQSKCSFYGKTHNAKMTTREARIMKEVFCDSELFMLNKDCKIFYALMQRGKVPAAMMPIGEL